MEEDHGMRRKIIREWMTLSADKRKTEEQAVVFAKKASQQNQFPRSRRDPEHLFRRTSYQKVLGWLAPRIGKA
jgi:RNase P protein component